LYPKWLYMEINALKKRNITPEQAVKILRKNGIETNEKDAKIILDFLYFLAKLSVDQYLKDNNELNDSIDNI